MKKIIVLSFLFITVFINSCKKDEINNSPNVTDNSVLEKRSDGIKIYDNVLCFSKMENFEQTLAMLQNASDAYENDFFAKNNPDGALKDDALDELVYSKGINFAQPLIDFENSFGLNSLRKKVAKEQEQWLALASDINDNTVDPENNEIIQDDIMQTLVSAGGEIKVGNSIHKYYQDGRHIEITDGNFETLDAIRKDASYASKARNVVTEILNSEKSMQSSCIQEERNSNVGTWASGKKKLKGVLSITNLTPFGHWLVAKEKAFKKHRFWFVTYWWPYSGAYLTVKLRGQLFYPGCTEKFYYVDQSYSHIGHKAKTSYHSSQGFRATSGQAYGFYKALDYNYDGVQFNLLF